MVYLVVFVEAARALRDVATVGSNDPFVALQCKGHQARTHTGSDAKDPGAPAQVLGGWDRGWCHIVACPGGNAMQPVSHMCAGWMRGRQSLTTSTPSLTWESSTMTRGTLSCT